MLDIELYWATLVSTLADDALAPDIARSSSAMFLTDMSTLYNNVANDVLFRLLLPGVPFTNMV